MILIRKLFEFHCRTSPTSLPTVDDAAVQRAVEEVAAAVAHQETEPQMSHAHAHDFGHGEAVTFSISRTFDKLC